MRELFENTPGENAMAAARRLARPAPRQRFYKSATVAAVEGGHGLGYGLRLDDKPVRTPARRVLAAPTLALAEAIAAEWQAQRDTIDPATMPLTRLANAIIDGVADHPGPVAAEVEKYLGSDLVCYRAASPEGLVARQAELWDPILTWARQALGARFVLAQGVVHVPQPEQAIAAACAAIPTDPWRLGAVNAVTTLTGSALIALALARGQLTADAAWRAAHVDEDWNEAQWGRDDLAAERHAFRFAEMQAAATVLGALSEQKLSD
jgi:chaperone required for assembly of F1-ATPase